MPSLKTQLSVLTMAIFFEICPQTTLALPPPEDTPEEVLRTEIILEGRSRITGEYLNATEYAEIQARLKNSRFAPQLDPQVREIILLLEIRKFLKTLFPIL